jgi:hypothetical protein
VTGVTGGATGTHDKMSKIKFLTEKLLKRTIQNHVLNTSGLPDLDEDILRNVSLNAIIKSIGKGANTAQIVEMMKHMKNNVAPKALFPYHNHKQEIQFHNIQELILHMKKEDIEDESGNGKSTSNAETPLQKTERAVKQLLKDVQESNKHDINELESFNGFKSLRHMFKQHLKATEKIAAEAGNRKQGLEGLFNHHLEAHTDIQSELKSADEYANSAIHKLNGDAKNLLDSSIVKKDTSEKYSDIEQSPSLKKMLAESSAALQNSENLANSDTINSERKAVMPNKLGVLVLKDVLKTYETNAGLCKWLQTTSFCDDKICHGQCQIKGYQRRIRKACTLKYNECLMDATVQYEKCLSDVMACSKNGNNNMLKAQ